MRTAALLLAFACCSPAFADVLSVPEETAATPRRANLPRKGETMQNVLRRYGEPRQKHAPAGGDAPRHPPITRWDYDGFSVFFEHAHVIDAVVPGHPPQVYHAEALKGG